jgi:hypothetical protein
MHKRRTLAHRSTTVTYGCLMDRSTRDKAIWIARFAARLLSFQPGMRVVDAVRIAEHHRARSPGDNPDDVAQLYFSERH